MTVIVHFRSLDDLDLNRKVLNVKDDTDLLGSINRFRVCIFQVDWINFYCNLMWLSKLLQRLPVCLRRIQFWRVAMYPSDPNVMIAMNYANPLQSQHKVRESMPDTDLSNKGMSPNLTPKRLLSKGKHLIWGTCRCVNYHSWWFSWWFRNPEQPPFWMVLKPVVNNGEQTANLNWLVGFFPSTVCNVYLYMCNHDIARL